jgi:superfamily II RNA helicase
LLSVDFASKDEKKALAEAIKGESFRSPHGKEMQKLIRHGIGLHHAGLLPRYRLLVEKLAQRGLLKIICGTDTLGVGVNVPIRTVLFTKLCKYDGEKVRILSARDFHQIAGRAGRKGFDTQGFVVALAPEHSVENLRLEAKSAAQGRKKFVRKKPPEWGYVHWDKAVFEKLVVSPPEPLQSRFQVSHGMLLSVLGRREGGCKAMKQLVKDSLETPQRKRHHKQEALQLLRSLWQAGIVEFRAASEGGGIRLNAELQAGFSLFQALGLFIVDAVERLDRESPTYALDVLTLVESICEDPEFVLRQQVDKLKGQKVAELKAAGVEYEERMAELEKIEHPKPNAEFLYGAFEAFALEHPWVTREVLKPKSVAREMVENLQSFSGYIKEYGLSRSEGLLLRYLSEVYKTLNQTIPELARNEELDDIIVHLGTLIRGVDSSLLDEWERLRDPEFQPAQQDADSEPVATDITTDARRFTALVRNIMFGVLRALEYGDYDTIADLIEPGEISLVPVELANRMRAFFTEGEGQHIQLDANARNPKNLTVQSGDDFWIVSQAILVNDEISEYSVRARVDLARSRLERRPIILLDHLGG